MCEFLQGELQTPRKHCDRHFLQSIAYGNGTVMTKDIKAMLGLVLHDDILTLAKHLLNQDAQACINFVRELSHKGENLTQALKDLSALFHQISIAQCLDNTDIANDIQTLATKISTHDLQLFYHIASNGNKELPLAPSEQIGFEMTVIMEHQTQHCFNVFGHYSAIAIGNRLVK
jgi:DNA polymerase-3 subunit gamma/tau